MRSWRQAASRQCAGVAALVLAVGGVGVVGCGRRVPNPPGTPQVRSEAPANPCSFLFPPVSLSPLTPAVPTQFITGQLGADCLAWQSFIALNWKADLAHPGYHDPNARPKDFGTPGDTSATVWESYHEASAVFSGVNARAVAWTSARLATKPLGRVSKLGAIDLSLSSIAQAGDSKWLTSQAGGLTYYEVRINQDEFEFITKNVFDGSDLTTYAGQAACAQAGTGGRGGFNLPAGRGSHTASDDVDCRGKKATYGQDQGAIEIKASWIALPADHSLDYRYKTAVAQITDPFGSVNQATVGLVGLHIVHKVPGAPQFTWATFEQIDNSPDDAGAGFTAPVLPHNPNRVARPTYAFFNPNCTKAGDPTYSCVHNAPPGKPCNASGQPKGCYPYAAPMQVTRIVPVDDQANMVTGYVWSQLPPKSVFNYYRLINVQWPNIPAAVAPGSTIPLPGGDITPSDDNGIVANTTLETFQQTTNSCMDCHRAAQVAQASHRAPSKLAGRNLTLLRPLSKPDAAAFYASDYSFVFLAETVR